MSFRVILDVSRRLRLRRRHQNRWSGRAGPRATHPVSPDPGRRPRHHRPRDRPRPRTTCRAPSTRTSGPSLPVDPRSPTTSYGRCATSRRSRPRSPRPERREGHDLHHRHRSRPASVDCVALAQSTGAGPDGRPRPRAAAGRGRWVPAQSVRPRAGDWAGVLGLLVPDITNPYVQATLSRGER